MFPAEVTAIFTNLLTNAVKFAGEGRRVQVTAIEDDTGLRIVIENTGAAVDLKDSQRWFEPFRSSTTEIDTTLGQGMGLGLTITRSMLDEYGATIRFIQPSEYFATAVEVLFPTD